MESERKLPTRRFVTHPLLSRPFAVPVMITQESFDDALRYQPTEDDVFICTYPKCGTTWLSYALLLMRNEGTPLGQGDQLISKVPFLDAVGKKFTEQVKGRPKFIKTHLPYELTPNNPKTKYLFVARNPKDVVVSFYFHSVGFPDNEFSDGKLEDFFEMFMAGEGEFGDYFECVSGWYDKSKTEGNVLFLLYENMIQNFEREFLKVTNFIGGEWTDKVLANGGELMGNILKHSSFSSMQKSSAAFEPKARRPEDEAVPFIRKGVSGNWKNHLTKEQSQRIDERMKEVGSVFKGFDKLWGSYSCA